MASSPRDGWTALHAFELREAAEAFAQAGDQPEAAAGALRAWSAEATLQADLQRLTGVAADRLFTTWSERGSLPEGAALVATLAARCSAADASRWGAELPVELRFLAVEPEPWTRFSATGQPDLSELPIAVAGRLAVHKAVHDGLPDAAMLQAARDPMFEVEANGITRSWYDPCVHRTLADAAAKRVGDDPGERLSAAARAGIAGTLFAPWLDGDDLAAQLVAGVPVDDLGSASAAVEAALGLPAKAPMSDEPDVARDEIRAMDRRLDAAKVGLDAAVDADGAAMLHQVGVVDRLRLEVLVQRARRDLRAGHHQRALATLLLARDVTDRTIGPRNSPALMVLLAEANLRAGRSREALDALQLLAGRRPEVLGLRELVGDLSVLQGLDRHGDSKEH
jgi:hypothetical protein